MREDIVTLIQQGLNTAFIDAKTISNLVYKAQFISKNHKSGRKVLASIEEELYVCDELQSVMYLLQ